MSTDGICNSVIIDLPEGAAGRIKRNIFVQGADKENYSAFIAVAAEARRNSSADLVVADNEAHQVRAAFAASALIADWSGAVKRLERNHLGTHVTLSRSVRSEATTFSGKLWKWLHSLSIGR